MTAPLRPVVVDAPGAADVVFGFAGTVARRAVGKLPLAVALLVVTQVSFRVAHFGRNRVGPYTYQVTSDLFKATLVSQSLFIVSIVLAVLVADEAVARGARRWPAYAFALLLGSAFAAWAQAALIDWFDWIPIHGLPREMMVTRPVELFLEAMLYGTFGCFVYVNHRTALLAAQRMRKAELARAQARRRTLESRLQAMQARIEPQFLFNTLGHVRDLHDEDVAAGGQMLDDLITYLRAALPHLRDSASTLGREIELARAYFDIVRRRLQDGAEMVVDVPDDLANARIPAMTLLPLVDHALARRLRLDGAGAPRGALRIEGTLRAQRLRVTISDADTSVPSAPDDAGPPGIGERLRTLYGADAMFDFACTAAGGTCATLEIPHESTDLRDR